MKNGLEEVRRAALSSFAFVRRHPLLLLVPVFCTDAAIRLFLFAVHKFYGRKHILLELLLLVTFSFPFGMLAEVVLARMLAMSRGKMQPTLEQALDVVQAPGLLSTLARLTGMTLLWVTLALALAAAFFISGFVAKAVLFGMGHHGAKMPPPHGWSFPYLWVSFVLGAALTARYSYVLPLLAAERRGSRELFRQGVALAKLNVRWLRIVNGLECATVLSISHVLRPLETDGSLRAVAVSGLSLLIASVFTTCFELIKAELAFAVQGSLATRPR